MSDALHPPGAGSRDPGPAASTLLQAWQDSRQLDALAPELRPATLAHGYDIQDALIALTGDAVAGWKLGVGSPAAMRQAGTQRALVGRLLCSRCFMAGSSSRDTSAGALTEAVTISGSRPLTVEFEIGFVLGRDIAPGDAPADPLAAVSSAHVGFELVLSRFADRRKVGQPSFAADNVGFEAYICGDPIEPRQIADVIASVQVELDGTCVARGLYGDEAVDPVVALRHLFDHARDRGLTLHRGDIVTAGAVARPFDVAAAEFDIAARYLDTRLAVHITSV
jgi:2-keto-4-pentenoate hydratase